MTRCCQGKFRNKILSDNWLLELEKCLKTSLLQYYCINLHRLPVKRMKSIVITFLAHSYLVLTHFQRKQLYAAEGLTLETPAFQNLLCWLVWLHFSFLSSVRLMPTKTDNFSVLILVSFWLSSILHNKLLQLLLIEIFFKLLSFSQEQEIEYSLKMTRNSG